MDYDKFADGFVETAFGSVHIRRHAAAGKKLMLLHGMGANVRTWERLVKFLPESMDICMLDLPGHGESAKPHTDYSINKVVDALSEVANAIGYGDFVMMGHSYGGWLAAAYARSRGCAGLILEDAAGLKAYFDDVFASVGAEKYKTDMVGSLIRMNNNDPKVMELIVNQDFGDMLLTEATLSGIHTATMVIWGRNDKVIDSSYAKLMHDSIPGSRLEMLDAGHTPHFSKPEEVAKLIIQFMDGL